MRVCLTQKVQVVCADREGDVVHLLFTRCQGTAEGEQNYRPSARAVEARCETGNQVCMAVLQYSALACLRTKADLPTHPLFCEVIFNSLWAI